MRDANIPDGIEDFLAYAPDTGVVSWRVHTGRCKAGEPAGTISSTGYLVLGFKGKKIRCHRVAWRLMTGEWPPGEIDHADLDKVNNRWANLRLADRSSNTHNQRPRVRDLPRGVQASGRWFYAHITFHNVDYRLGRFSTAEAAHEAYARAAREFHGEFARVA